MDETTEARSRGAAEIGAGRTAAAVTFVTEIESQLRQVGHYKLLERIGEGGFGTVWMAEQEQPVRRRVALKIIKLGMDTRQVIARFEQERQALAMMEHPNIARVLDAGATETGRPYFVMELVRGRPITQYCDEHKLSLQERLELFADVCHAVQHAHTKGIIHRDVKPSNVLVSQHDDKPVVKVIDFGIAKATAGRLTEKTLFTEFRQFIGTPAYMSPEQAGMSDLDVDTRSDVYSLGVLLFELLTGETPFDSKRLLSAGYDEMRRIIREEEPPRPSTRLSESGKVGTWESQKAPNQVSGEHAPLGVDDAPNPKSTIQNPKSSAADIAAARLSDPRTLIRALRGDLDWIVLKCLEKDRARRYETAIGLAQDLQRYLTGDPVLAAPPSAAYRMRKFVRRNRAAVLTVGLVAAALILGVIGTGSGLIWALRERSRAEGEAQNARLAAEAEKKVRVKAEKITEYIQNMFASADPHETPKGPGYTVRQMLDEIAGDVGSGLEGQPEIEATIRITIGGAYRGLAKYEQADKQLEAAMGLARTASNKKIEAGVLVSQAAVLHDRGRYAAAEAKLREALDIRRRLFGTDNLEVLACMSPLADMVRHQARYSEAESTGRKALAERRKFLGEEHMDVALSLNDLGLTLVDKGDFAGAESAYNEARAMYRKLAGDEHPFLADTLGNLGRLRSTLGDLAGAKSLHLEALAIRRKVYGDHHPAVATEQHRLALLMRDNGDLSGAEALVREALSTRRTFLGEEHLDVAWSLYDLGDLLRLLGDPTAGEPHVREALSIMRKFLGDEHPDVATSLNMLGFVLGNMSDFSGAEIVFRESLEMRRRLLGDGHPDVAASLNNLAWIHQELGRADLAEALFRESLDLRRKTHGGAHPDVALGLMNLASSIMDRGRTAEAVPLLQEALEMRLCLFAGDGTEPGDAAKEIRRTRRRREAEALAVEAGKRRASSLRAAEFVHRPGAAAHG